MAFPTSSNADVTDGASPRHLAELLLAAEVGEDSDPSRMAAAVDRACLKLTDTLNTVIGDWGVIAVLRGALKSTAERFPWLTADPAPGESECLTGLQLSWQGQDPAKVAEASTSLLANIVEVLLDLLGHDLVYVFLREAWPEVKFP